MSDRTYITVPPKGSLPTAEVAFKDQLAVIRGSGGQFDKLYFCRATYTGAGYEWVELTAHQIIVQEGGVATDATVTTLNFDASDFTVTESPEDTVTIGLAYGTSAGTPAEGNHTHAAATFTVQEEDSTVSSVATTLDFDGSDFNISDEGSGEVRISLAYGTTAGTPSEGNHTHAGGGLTVQEGDSTVDANVTTLDFDASDFNVTSSPAGEANIALAYGTTAGTPAEGNHTHAGGGMTVEEGDSVIDANVTVLDFDASDFNVTSSPAGEANISLAYGTSAGTPAEGNHTHTATITVQEGDSTVDSAVTTLDFDASDFNVTSSPAGEANIALAYGTSAGTPAEGNHTHTYTITVQEGDSTVDSAVTTLDFDASDFNVSSSPGGEANISLAYGNGAGQPAEGDHNHTGTYQPLDATLTALAAYNTNGLIAQTAADTFAGRTITGTANQIDVTNGSGVSGNPTLAIAANLLASLLVIDGEAQNSSDTANTTDTTNYSTASTKDVTFPAGTFTLHALGFCTLIHSASGAANLRLAVDGNAMTGSTIAESVPSSEGQTVVTYGTLTGISGDGAGGAGDVTIALQFKSSAAGTTSADQPMWFVVAVRTA